MLLKSFNFAISFLNITTTAKSLLLVMKNGSNKPTYLFCQNSSYYILSKVHTIYIIQPLKKVKIYIPISKMGASAQ